MMRLMILSAVLGLAGCVAMNPVTMLRLATLNPLDADPAAIAVQLTLPEGVGVADGSAAMIIQTTFANGEEVSERFELEILPEDIWRVSPADREELRALQERVMAAEDMDPDNTSGSFAVGFEPCAIGGGPGQDARFSIAIQLEVGESFLPLVNSARVSDVYDVEDVGTLEACDATG